MNFECPLHFFSTRVLLAFCAPVGCQFCASWLPVLCQFCASFVPVGCQSTGTKLAQNWQPTGTKLAANWHTTGAKSLWRTLVPKKIEWSLKMHVLSEYTLFWFGMWSLVGRSCRNSQLDPTGTQLAQNWQPIFYQKLEKKQSQNLTIVRKIFS